MQEPPTWKEGWLTKQGGFIRSWKKRWFVLQGNKMYYYVDQGKQQLQGLIDLEGSSVNIDNEMVRGKEHCLEIVSPTRTYPIVAETSEDLEAWMNAIIKASLWQPGSQIAVVSKVEDTSVTWSVKGMMSECCQKEIQNLITISLGNVKFNVDLGNETVSITGRFDRNKVFMILEDAGYFIYPMNN